MQMKNSDWTIQDNSLKRTFKFKDFKVAFSFMTVVSYLCEEHNHHPDWSNSYNTVSISLTTHDADSTVTDKDYKLAKAIDKASSQYEVKE